MQHDVEQKPLELDDRRTAPRVCPPSVIADEKLNSSPLSYGDLRRMAFHGSVEHRRNRRAVILVATATLPAMLLVAHCASAIASGSIVWQTARDILNVVSPLASQ